MSRLLDFYRGEAVDDRGRSLDAILARDDDWLEATHDFVQWLFPLPEPSGVNPAAPLVTDEVREAFAAEPALRVRLLASFDRMLRFYGLERAGEFVRPSRDWPVRKHEWFTGGGHNDLRITRILRCLAVLGCRQQARALLDCLEQLARSEPVCGVNSRAFDYWRRAVPAAS